MSINSIYYDLSISGIEFEFSDQPLVASQESLQLTPAQLSERVQSALDRQVELLCSDQILRVPVLRLSKTEYDKAKGGYVDKRMAKLFLAQAKMGEDVLLKKAEWNDRLLVPIRNAFNGAMSSLYLTKLWVSSEKLHIMNSHGHCVGMSRTFEHLCLRVREKKGTLTRMDVIRIAALLSGGATEEAAIEQGREHRNGGLYNDGFFVVPIILTPLADLSPGYLSSEISEKFGVYEFHRGRHRMAFVQSDDGSSLLFEPQGGLIDIKERLKEFFEDADCVKRFESWKDKYTAAREELLEEIFLNKNAQPELVQATRTMLNNWITNQTQEFKHHRFIGVDTKLCQSADEIFHAIEGKLMQRFWKLGTEYALIAKKALRPAILPTLSH